MWIVIPFLNFKIIPLICTILENCSFEEFCSGWSWLYNGVFSSLAHLFVFGTF